MDINVISRQRHRHTATERLQVVEQFRRSGLSRTEFSRQFGIPVSTLDAWRVKSKRDSNLPAPAVFNEIRFATAPVIAPGPWVMEIVAPSGLTIRSREALPTRDLVRRPGSASRVINMSAGIPNCVSVVFI
jgi:hypothetical protein